MGLENYRTSPVNPNDAVGGGGCLCHPDGKAADCKGPYITFPASETYPNTSPHAVVCQRCVIGAAQTIRGASDSTVDFQASQVEEQPAETIQWDELTEAQQASASFAAGELVRTVAGVVRVPSDVTDVLDTPDPGGSDPSDVRPETVASLEDRFVDPDPGDVDRDNKVLADIDKEDVIEV